MPPITEEELLSSLTLEAQARLGVDGRFRMVHPSRVDDRAIIDSARAVALAETFLHTFGKYSLGRYELLHGAPIDLESLGVGRIYFAESPHITLPEGTDGPLERALGPYFVVHFYQDDDPAVTVSVSALATDLNADGNGPIFPRHRTAGHEFASSGIPLGALSTPEEAAVNTARRTGRQVSEAPALVLRGWAGPDLARWRLRLDMPREVRDESSTRFMASELYLDDSRNLFFPHLSQPARSFDRDVHKRGVGRVNVTADRRPGFPVSYISVEATEGNR